jgi:hypothetical protein
MDTDIIELTEVIETDSCFLVPHEEGQDLMPAEVANHLHTRWAQSKDQ